jgi:hypothetical protein
MNGTTWHGKETSVAKAHHDSSSMSRGVAAVSFDREAGNVDLGKTDFYLNDPPPVNAVSRVRYVESKKAMKYKIEEKMAPTDGFLYIRRGIIRNVVMDSMIHGRKISVNLFCAITDNSVDASIDHDEEMSFFSKFSSESWDRNFVKCNTAFCNYARKWPKVFLKEKNLDRIPGCLENFTSLNELYLSNNDISKIDGLEKMDNLKILAINSNRVNKIEGLDDLDKLTHLSLTGNRISKLEGLDNLKKLESLHLEDNRINLGNVERISLPGRLEELWLDNNGITGEKLFDLEMHLEKTMPRLHLEK